jgi:Fe-S cluster assembly protein SufD
MNGLNPESYKYSPVSLLPEIADHNDSKRVEVGDGEHQELVSFFEGAQDLKGGLEITIGKNASLHHWLVFKEEESSVHLEELNVLVDANANYTLNAVTLGSKWSRADIHIRLIGQHAECHLLGLDLASGSAHIDRHLLIEHEVPNTKSTQLFKGIFDQSSTASFYGKIKVLHGADGSSASQTNRNLLLSPGATVNTRPQLEIDTDEVSCTHGATVGQLDEDAVFFLRSRGLSEGEARSLLTEAFAREVLTAFKASAQKDDIEKCVLAWLRRGV